MKSQKYGHRNECFLKALHQENSLRYDISLTMKEVFY